MAPFDTENSVNDDEQSSVIKGSSSKASGAPVEKINPLGREVTLLSAVMLNVGQITGSGIYAVPGTIFSSVGSIGMLFIYWILGPLFAFAGLTLYSELASMFPNRSGAEVVYLEQAYPRPRFLVSSTFAVTAVLMSFSASNAVVFAQYTLTALEIPLTDFNQTLTALLVVLVTVGVVAVSTKWSLRLVNFLTIVKIMSLAFMVVTGLAVLLGLTHIKDPYANFHNLFEGTSSNPNALATALLSKVKVNHAFVGWHNAYNVLGEVKGRDPVRTVRKASIISLSLMTVLFLLVNIAYVAVIPREDIRNSGQLIAAVLLVSFFSSTRPFGTPLGPAILKVGLTYFVILAVPAQDAFNFVLDLASYPNLIFQSAMCVGVWVLRKRRALAGQARSLLQAHNSVVITYLLSCIFLLVMPWVPPEPGHADVSFWYATYCVAGLALIALCGIYYYIWIILLPKLGGYEVVEEFETLPDGARNARLVRRYKSVDDPRQSLLSSTE
ncbi:hypothetical protein H0H92_014701 [Tricholoma furcatifolium]|nr:hypothetical protein H0H92_014701 [Tricholoma furcatifolium]